MYETDMGLHDRTVRNTYTKQEVTSSKFLSKVYGYMFIALLITSVIAVITGFGFDYALRSATEEMAETIISGLLVALVISSLGLIICSFVISFMGARRGGNIMIPGILYTIFMGVIVGTILFPFSLDGEWWIVISAFGITALVFGIMYIVGATVKTNLNYLGMLGFGMMFGAMVMSIGFFIFYLISPATFDWLYVLIDSIIFVAFLLITMWDVWRIQKIANSASEDQNLAMYLAFNLYSDFVYIFLRVLMIVAKFSKRN